MSRQRPQRQRREFGEQDMLPVFGPSLSGDGSPRCSDWTRKHEPCARMATVPADHRHGPLCRQHANQRRSGVVGDGPPWLRLPGQGQAVLVTGTRC